MNAPAIPATLADLQSEYQKANPVDIAGYGNESTHQGYLSWILNSSNNPALAVRLADALIREVTPAWRGPQIGDFEAVPTEQTHCLKELKLGPESVIDLLLHFRKGEKSFCLGLELKTDRGPSSREQFKKMRCGLEHLHAVPCVGAIVLTLGAAAALQHSKSPQGEAIVLHHSGLFDKFVAIDAGRLYSLWSEIIYSDERYIRQVGGSSNTMDYLNALRLEAARQRFAHQAYLQVKQGAANPSHETDAKEDPYQKWGFRSYRDAIMYTYIAVREHLWCHRPEFEWVAELQQHNVIMGGLNNGEQFFPVKDVAGLSWYYEFNDDRFHLKVRNEAKDIGAAEHWIREVRNKALQLTSLSDKLIPLGGQGYRGTWITVAKWDVDFSDIDAACQGVVHLMSLLEKPSILGSPHPTA